MLRLYVEIIVSPTFVPALAKGVGDSNMHFNAALKGRSSTKAALPPGTRHNNPGTALVMAERSHIADHLDHFHHAAVFVSENVAMQHICAGEIDKSAAHLYVAAHWDGNVVPPDPGFRQLDFVFYVLCAVERNYLEWVDMNVEWMRCSATARVIVVKRPLFHVSKLHRLLEVLILKFPVIDGMAGRHVADWISPGRGSALETKATGKIGLSFEIIQEQWHL